MALTAKRVNDLSERGRYGDRDGLYLQVASATSKSWLFRYELNGRERWMGLGAAKTFNLEEARHRARVARQKLSDGIDPIEAKRQAKIARALEAAKSMTFKQAAEAFHTEHGAKWGNRKHAAQFMTSLEQHAFPHIGRLPVAHIEKGHVLKVLKPIWATKTATASRIRGRIEKVLTWAEGHDLRSGPNPAEWRRLSGVLPAKNELARVQHLEALPFSEMPNFMTRLAEREGIAARALELCILTATRTAEITGARWLEIDLAAMIWIIPPNRMKGKREHRVPLSKRAVSLLSALPREGDFVFPGWKKGEAKRS